MTDRSQLQNEHLTLEVASLGAEMQYLRTQQGDDLLWHGDAAFWTGRAPVLFPIVGRAVGDVVAVGDHTASMSQHGFARRCEFTLLEQTDLMCRHVLKENDETQAVFPFSFALVVSHRLDGNTLHVSAEVANTSDAPMPFGFGFHPAFCWPLPGAKDTAHYVTLAGRGVPAMHLLEDGLLRSNPMPSPFKNGELEISEDLFTDGAWVFPNGSDSLRYGAPDGPALEFTFQNLPDLALWRPTSAPFLCVEPWRGTASYIGDGPQIEDRPNSLMLAAGSKVQLGYSVKVTM